MKVLLTNLPSQGMQIKHIQQKLCLQRTRTQ